MAKGLAGEALHQVALHGATRKFLGDDQAETGTGIAPGTVMEIEAVAAQNPTGSENGGKIIRLVQPVLVAKS